MSRVVWLLVAVSLAAGCRGRLVGHFGDRAFYHVRDHYRIRYAPGAGGVLSNDWSIDNYQVDRGSRRPTTALASSRWWTSFAIERDDGQVEQIRGVEIFDVRLTHRRDGSVIYVRTLPLPTSMAERDLQVIMRDYIDRSSGGSYVPASLFGEPAIREHRSAPRVLREGHALAGGQRAYHATIEIVDVDRNRIDPSARGELLTVVLLRPGAHAWVSPRGARLPMLVLAGLAARPEHHSARLEEFADFVSRLDVRPD